jgi:acetyl esterase/lipase
MSVRYKAMTKLLVAMANREGAEITVDGLRALVGPPSEKDTSVKGVTFSPTTLGGIPAERISLDAIESQGELLCFHGGGYIAGTARHFRSFFGAMSRELALTGTSVDYRLAPEHPYPAAVDDAVSAYEALLSSGTSPDRIVVTGESAGGGLAAALVLAARTRGLPLPRALLLWWPFLDLTGEGETVRTNAGRDFLTSQLIQLSAQSYLGTTDPHEPQAAPLFAEVADLKGLPPVHLQVGEFDLLRSDAETFTAKLRVAEVTADLIVKKDGVHGFATSGDDLPEGRDAIAAAAAWLRALGTK